jgi:hypothetical protein
LQHEAPVLCGLRGHETEGKDKASARVVHTKTVDERHTDFVRIERPVNLDHPIWTESASLFNERVIREEDSFQHLLGNDIQIISDEFPVRTVRPILSF